MQLFSRYTGAYLQLFSTFDVGLTLRFALVSPEEERIINAYRYDGDEENVEKHAYRINLDNLADGVVIPYYTEAKDPPWFAGLWGSGSDSVAAKVQLFIEIEKQSATFRSDVGELDE